LAPLVDWVARNTRPDDVLASDNDPLVHLYTGRHVVPSARWAAEIYPGTPDTTSRVADLRAILSAYPVRYLLLGGTSSPSAPASSVLRAGPNPRLQLLTPIAGGGAVFTTAPGASQD
jgi:hypothetical protein